jgi:hypothetical protein
MTPIRANIVGPPCVGTKINAFRGLVLDPRKLRDVVAGVLERDELATARQRYQIVARQQRTRGSHAGDRVSTCHPMTRG